MRCLDRYPGQALGQVQADAGHRALRHPPGQRGPGQCGEQLGCGGADIAASVGQRLLQERLVRGREPGAQGVEKHQPVLGPLRGPRGGEQLPPGPWRLGPYRGQQCDPLGEQAFLPEVLNGPGVRGPGQHRTARRAAQCESPLRVEPGEPQPARPREGQRLWPQIRTCPGRVEQRVQERGRSAVAVPRRCRQPLGQQFGEVRRRAAPASRTRGPRPVGEQLGQPVPGGQGRLGSWIGRGRGGPRTGRCGKQARPAPYGVQRCRIQKSGRTGRRRTPIGAEQSRRHELFPGDGAGHRFPPRLVRMRLCRRVRPGPGHVWPDRIRGYVQLTAWFCQ